MALMKCQECGHDVSTTAKACPSCGAKPKPPFNKKMTVGRWLMVIFLGYCAYSAYKDKTMTPQEKAAQAAADAERTCNDGAKAYLLSQRFVKERLTSPATAEFPPKKEVIFHQIPDSCLHVVGAYVDSQNVYGATLRTRYLASLDYEKGPKLWKLIELKILD